MIIFRQTLTSDLPECLSLIGNEFGSVDEQTLLEFWTTLLTQSRALSALVVERTEETSRIVGFGMALCVTDELRDKIISLQDPYILQYLLAHWKEGGQGILNDVEIRQQNEESGLVILGLHTLWGLPGMSDDECAPYRDYMMKSLFATMQGYNIRYFFKQIYGKPDFDRHITFGFNARNEYPEVEDGVLHPYLVGMSRDEAMHASMEGRAIRQLFHYSPPQCGFNPDQQALLQLAISGLTDTHIAQVLTVQKDVVRELWDGIYLAIPDQIASILFQGHEYRQRRTAVITWVKQHVEEVRPARYFDNIDTLGDRPTEKPQVITDRKYVRNEAQPSLGGTLLRSLRKERNLSLEELAYTVGITPLALGNIERSPVVAQRARVIALLDALHSIQPLPAPVRQQVLTHYGYTDDVSQPTEQDFLRIEAEWESSFAHANVPAYVVDICQVILRWNDLAQMVIGEIPREAQVTLFDLLFSDQARGLLTLENGDEVIRTTVKHIHADMYPYRDTVWCQDIIAAAKKKYPEFAILYDECERQGAPQKEVCAIELVALRDPLGRELRFRQVGLDMLRDTRYRVVQYIPQDAQTMEILTGIVSENI